MEIVFMRSDPAGRKDETRMATNVRAKIEDHSLLRSTPEAERQKEVEQQDVEAA